MSGFISLASALHGAVPNYEDRRGVEDFGASIAAQPVPFLPVSLIDDGDPMFSFATAWWPGAASIAGGEEGMLAGEGWSLPSWTTSGANGRLGFVGVTRDANGSAIGDCTVRCFRTSSNELVSQVTSDANGNYIATTPYNDGHYIVVHKSSTVAGASVDNLIPG